MGELLATAGLRGQIARFLHKHKDDGPAPPKGQQQQQTQQPGQDANKI
jgi:hypothetical protein